MSHDSKADVRRRTGWLPADQNDLEQWIEGHRDRVEAKGDVALHPVLVEFQHLIDTDPVVRQYLNQMITQVPRTKPYRKRHLHDVEQLLSLINEVLTMAPEFGEHTMVATPPRRDPRLDDGHPGRLRRLPRSEDQRDAQEAAYSVV